MRAFEPPNPPLTASSIQFTQVDFYNDIRAYLSELQNTTVRSLDDMVAFNDQYTASEGGEPVSQCRGLCGAYAHSRRVGLFGRDRVRLQHLHQARMRFWRVSGLWGSRTRPIRKRSCVVSISPARDPDLIRLTRHGIALRVGSWASIMHSTISYPPENM